MKKASFLISLPLVLGLSGCVISVGGGEHSEWGSEWEKTQKDNRSIIARLNIGDSRDQVLNMLGEPAFSESFSHNNSDYQIYYFRTHRAHGDGHTTKDETTPVLFVGGKVSGWGQQALDQAMDISG